MSSAHQHVIPFHFFSLSQNAIVFFMHPSDIVFISIVIIWINSPSTMIFVVYIKYMLCVRIDSIVREVKIEQSIRLSWQPVIEFLAAYVHIQVIINIWYRISTLLSSFIEYSNSFERTREAVNASKCNLQPNDENSFSFLIYLNILYCTNRESCVAQAQTPCGMWMGTSQQMLILLLLYSAMLRASLRPGCHLCVVLGTLLNTISGC